jgi:hypothetical protein
MEFYQIDYSTRRNVIGTFPQVITADYQSSVQAPNFLGNINFEKVPADVVIPNPILHKSAKLTDLICAPIMGFHLKLLISPKLKNIFESYRNEDLEYLNTDIIGKDNSVINFYVVNFIEKNMGFLDFSNSEIVLKKRDENRKAYKEIININSLGEFNQLLSKKKELNYNQCNIEKIKFDHKKVSEHFFVLTEVSGGVGYFVSKELKEQIEGQGCTGLNFKIV